MIAAQYGMLQVVRVLLRFHARVDVFDEVRKFEYRQLSLKVPLRSNY